MQLWLVRHALPLVEQGICYGRLDVAADAQASTDAARALADLLPAAMGGLCSPLQRCSALRDALQTLRPDLQLRTEPHLAEMDFGTWEGQRWDAIGQAAVAAWTADFGQHRPGGGESANAVLLRVGTLLDAAQAAGTDTVWLTHAGVIRAARLWAAGKRQLHSAADWPAEAPAFGQWETLTLG
ncbi:MAG: histidine phosphatase family protein [Pseudomonadota bacterium]